MRCARDIATFLEVQPPIMSLLQTVADLHIDDCWIGAGLIRNAVWDHLHGDPIQPATRSDVDVIYCDHTNATLDRDIEIEEHLARNCAGIPWSVHNQARMHDRNGDARYKDCEGAIRFWPETATAIAARLEDRRCQLIAPLGIDDLIGLIVRPTPAFEKKLPIFRNRMATKDWARRWPKLIFVGC